MYRFPTHSECCVFIVHRPTFTSYNEPLKQAKKTLPLFHYSIAVGRRVTANTCPSNLISIHFVMPRPHYSHATENPLKFANEKKKIAVGCCIDIKISEKSNYNVHVLSHRIASATNNRRQNRMWNLIHRVSQITHAPFAMHWQRCVCMYAVQ